MMDTTRELHRELRIEAARSLRDARRFKGITTLREWYAGRYQAFKHSAAMLNIALRHDKHLEELNR